MSWRDYMKYPMLIPKHNTEVEDMLDIMEELIPITVDDIIWDDRIGIILNWISKCIKAGIIHEGEKQRIQFKLIHDYGGF